MRLSAFTPFPRLWPLLGLAALPLLALAALLLGPGAALSQNAPSVTGVEVSSSPASGGAYVIGDTIQVTLTFSEDVNVTGSPRLKIDMDLAAWGEKWAAYEGGSGSASLTFTHTVVQPNYSTQGIAVLADSLELNGGTIRSASSDTSADLSHTRLNHNPDHRVNWRLSSAEIPWVTRAEVSSTPASGDTYGLDETIRVTLAFNRAVNATGTPRLKIDMDPADSGEKWAAYESGDGEASLTFAHAVVEPNISTQGIAVLADSLELNGGAIRSASSQTNADLSHTGLDHDSGHKVDWQRSASEPAEEPTATPTPEPPPARPARLRITAERGSLEVSLDWDDVEGADTYLVRWRSVDDGGKLNAGVEVETSQAGITVADYGQWVARVEACNGSGCGDPLAKKFTVKPAPVTITWLKPDNEAPAVNAQAENYENFTGALSVARGARVSKSFAGIFTDPDGDDLTYTVSIAEAHRPLVNELTITLDAPLSSSSLPEGYFPRLFFQTESDSDWKAASPALADPLTVTATVTATDPGGLSASVEGVFAVDWESHPELASATSTGTAIELTFDVAVEDDPAPAAGQFTVNVANADETTGTIAVTGVSVNGKVATLALASAPQTDQTVTLDYEHDDDSPLKRAADGGDHAPDFTGQAVTVSAPSPSLDLRLAPSSATNPSASARSITASWNPLDGATSQNLNWRRAGDDSRQWNTRRLPGDQSTANIEVESDGLHDVSIEVLGPRGRVALEPTRWTCGSRRGSTRSCQRSSPPCPMAASPGRLTASGPCSPAAASN